MNQGLLTLNELFTNAFHNYKNKTAINYKNKKMTYNELRIFSNQIAHSLIDCGVKRNTRVALLMSNRIEYVISLIGIYQSGCSRVALNDMLGEEEIRYILKDSNARVLIVEEKYFDIIKNIKNDLPHLKTIVGISDTKKVPSSFVSWNLFQNNRCKDDLKIDIYPDDLSDLSYTGGTTGNPKGVVSTHQKSFYIIITVILTSEISSDEKMLLVTPLPHASGLNLLAGLAKGAEVFLEDKFNIKHFLETVEEDKITFSNMVPTMIYRLLDYIKDHNYDTSSLRTLLYGTAPITLERLKEALKVFGPIFIQTYGLTETPGAATKLSKEDHQLLGEQESEKLKSCGQPTMLSLVKIIDDNGIEVPRNMEGEIIVKSPVNMVEYFNLPDKTSETLKGGWLYTGDIGKMDEDNYVFVLDRKKDMIISGGLNVYSSEVENVIQKHPKVNQVAVVGIPHPDWGEAVTAFIISEQEELTYEEIKKWCESKLSKYKHPKIINFVTSFPLTPYGKIDKKTLRAPYWEGTKRTI